MGIETGTVRGRLMLMAKMRSPEGESASEKHAYGCRLKEEPDGLEIAWHECTNGSDADIRLTVRDDEAVMHRTGDTEGHLRFIRGSRQPGIYHTPYGNFEMVTDTHEVSRMRDDKGGVIRLKYDLYLNGQISSMNEMELIWRL